jgi:hypothetical protein
MMRQRWRTVGPAHLDQYAVEPQTLPNLRPSRSGLIDDPNVPIDTYCSERAPKDQACLRLNSLFAGSMECGHRWAVLLGVVSTARRLGLDLEAYLTWMFERRGTRKNDFGLTAAQLTPAAYKRMLDEQSQERVAACGLGVHGVDLPGGASQASGVH